MRKKVVTYMIITLILWSNLTACGKNNAVSPENPPATNVEKPKEENKKIEEENKKTEEIILEETIEEDVQKERNKVQAVLAEIPYYGDDSICKMTAEQATAFAQLIADGLAGDFSLRGEYDEEVYDVLSWSEPFSINQVDAYINGYETNRNNVMLGDFSGNGIPYLYIASSLEPSSFEVYGWKDSKVVLTSSGERYLRSNYALSEQDDGTVRFVEQCIGVETYAEVNTEYAFVNGGMEPVYELIVDMPPWEDVVEGEPYHIIENGVEIGTCKPEEYEAFIEKEPHQHAQSFDCFYDVQPCTLEEMLNYLNVYASAMSNGQSTSVEIKK